MSVGAELLCQCAHRGGRRHHPTHIDGGADWAWAGALIRPSGPPAPGAPCWAARCIGSFVEVKNSTLADGAKANHLAYLGDATVGEARELAPAASPPTTTAPTSTAR